MTGLWSSELLVFFFQAEDGIRDYKVTGVQTCALPIYLTGDGAAGGASLGERRRGQQRAQEGEARDSEPPTDGGRHGRSSVWKGHGARSEERRVGKEGRSRWSPYH